MRKHIFLITFVIALVRVFANSEILEKYSNDHKTVFLTGAAGFIGSNFLVHLFDNYPEYDFIVLDALTYAGSLENIPEYIRESSRFQFIHGSVVDFPLVDQIMPRANFVVHFAAESHVTRSIMDDYVFFDTEVMGTRTLMASLVKNKNKVERFIHISTSEVYGTAECEPMDENHPLNPRSPYAASKAGADRLVYAYGCTYDVPVVIIRPFNNYGPRQHLEKMIPHFIASAIRNEPLTIHGSGEQSRDWIHTQDLALALDKVLHIPDFSPLKNQVINIGSGRPTSVLEIAKLILAAFNLPDSYLKFIEDRPGQVDCHISSREKSFRLLDWKPTITLEEGIKSTIDWYITHPNHWKKMEDQEIVQVIPSEIPYLLNSI